MADNVIELPGGKIVNGKLILDESPEAWKKWQQDARDMDATRIRIQKTLDEYEKESDTSNDTDMATIEILSATQGSPLTSAPTIERPRTIAQAQSTGSIYYWSKGKKKLAIYANQLETFKLSQAYKEGEGSALSQARKWMEAQVLSGNPVNFNAVGGIPKEVLGEGWDNLIETIPESVLEGAELTDPSEYGFGVSQDYGMALPTFDEEMGTWTAAHDLASRAQRKWDAGIKPTGDVQAEWDSIISEAAVADVKSKLPVALQDALTSGVGADISKAFIAAQQKKAGLLPDVDFAPTDPENQLVGADVKVDAVPAMEPGILEKIYNYGPSNLPSIKDIADYRGAFNWPSATDIVSTAKEAGRDVLDWATTPEALAVTGAPVETDFDAYAREQEIQQAQQAQRLAAEYGDMYQEEFSDFPGITGINTLGGSKTAFRDRPPVPITSPGEQAVAGLIPRNQVEGGIGDFGDYPNLELPVNQFAEVFKNIPSLKPGDYESITVNPDGSVTYVEKPDVLSPPWAGADTSPRSSDVGDFDNFVGDTKFREYTDRNPDVMEGLSSEKVNTLLDNPALQEAYLRERWYLTNQKFFARDYKESELVRPLVSREPEFFKLM